MSVAPDEMGQQLAEEQATANQATQNLIATTQDFSPPENTQPAFDEAAPQNHFNEIVGLSPLLMALGAVGGALGRAHGIAMLASTNAMMKGMVTGADEQYADARQQYDRKYQQWKDQSRTWFDSYKAYISAYKGRIDAQARAVQGANAAIGITQKNMKMSQQQVAQTAKISAQIDDIHSKIAARSTHEETERIRADSEKQRVIDAEKNSAIKYAQVDNQTKTADANAMTAMSRSIKGEVDGILKQYPASAGARPPDVDAKLKGLRDSLDLINERMKHLSDADYNKNRDVYDQARAAIAAGKDPAAVKQRLIDMKLDPNML
jgi:hypothetical protein